MILGFNVYTYLNPSMPEPVVIEKERIVEVEVKPKLKDIEISHTKVKGDIKVMVNHLSTISVVTSVKNGSLFINETELKLSESDIEIYHSDLTRSNDRSILEINLQEIKK